MLRTDLADRLRSRTLADGYVRPDYGGYCFGHVPATAASVLGADLGRSLPDDVFDGVDTDVDTALVLLVDAFGFDQFREASGDHAFFDRLTEAGRVTPLTGIYPTETTACVTTMHTGRMPVEHGLLGWSSYDEDVDEVFEALPNRVRATGEEPSVAPEDLFEGETVYERLARAGVDSYTVEDHDGDNAYAHRSTAGATSVRTDGVADFALSVRRTLETAAAEDRPTYVYAYYPMVDHAAHVAGTRSERHDAELAALSGALDRELSARLDESVAERTLLTMVADHGHVDTDPATNRDLLSDDQVANAVRHDRHGEPLLAGGPRNVHLWVRDGTERRLREHLDGTFDALVRTREEALAEGLWGPGEPSATFRRRVGDLLLVPREASTWIGGSADLEMVGMHGGLHPRETLVPFGAARLDALADPE